MTGAVRAIETHYKGHRFRSRLEARWAVLFDSLNIAWDYEPEGYLVGPNRRPYLPDFWLPKERIWVEVKGSEDHLDIGLIVDAAIPHDGLPDASNTVSEHRVRMLILGPIRTGVRRIFDERTREHVGYCQPAHTVLTFRKGDLFQGAGFFTAAGLEVSPGDALIANDGGEICWETRGSGWGNLVGGGGSISDSYEVVVANAYRAARSARFEHGESG